MANLNMKAAFYAAINKGDANEVDRLIDAGADIEGVDYLYAFSTKTYYILKTSNR